MASLVMALQWSGRRFQDQPKLRFMVGFAGIKCVRRGTADSTPEPAGLTNGPVPPRGNAGPACGWHSCMLLGDGGNTDTVFPPASSASTSTVPCGRLVQASHQAAEPALRRAGRGAGLPHHRRPRSHQGGMGRVQSAAGCGCVMLAGRVWGPACCGHGSEQVRAPRRPPTRARGDGLGS